MPEEATLGREFQEITGSSGQSLDQGLSNVYSNAPLSRMPDSQFSQVSPETRQLLAESALRDIGADQSRIAEAPVQQFIRGEFGGRAPAGGGAGAGTPGTVPGATGTGGSQPAGAGGELSLTDLINQRYQGILDKKPVSEEELLKQEMKALQGRIDAVNQVFGERISRERMAGVGRLGQVRAMNTVSGTQYSPFGTARTEQTSDLNEQNIRAIEGEKNAMIQELMGTAREGARAKASEAADRQMQATDAYISSMAQAYNLDAQEQEALRQNAARIAQLTGYYGGEKTLDKQAQELTLRKYLSDVEFQAQENDRQNAQLDLQIQQAQRDGYAISTQPDGTIIAINLDTMEIRELGNYAKITARSGGGGGGGSSSSGGSNRWSGDMPSTGDFQLFQEVQSGNVPITSLDATEKKSTTSFGVSDLLEPS